MLSTLLALTLGAAPDPVLVRALADRILACRHEPTGLLLMVPMAEGRPGGVSPYFAHFAA